MNHDYGNSKSLFLLLFPQYATHVTKLSGCLGIRRGGQPYMCQNVVLTIKSWVPYVAPSVYLQPLAAAGTWPPLRCLDCKKKVRIVEEQEAMAQLHLVEQNSPVGTGPLRQPARFNYKILLVNPYTTQWFPYKSIWQGYLHFTLLDVVLSFIIISNKMIIISALLNVSICLHVLTCY